MTALTVKTALETGLSAISTGFQTAWENVKFTPVTGIPFQRVNTLFADPDNPALGSSSYRELGIFQVSLFYPLNAGSLDALTRAQLIRDTFRRGQKFGSVVIKNTPTISAGIINEDRYIVTIKARFFQDSI